MKIARQGGKQRRLLLCSSCHRLLSTLHIPGIDLLHIHCTRLPFSLVEARDFHSSKMSANNIPTRNRPIFDNLTTEKEKFKVVMDEYNDMKDTDQDGLDFANKTAMWIAFERDVESQRVDRLFNDSLAKHFVEPYGKRLSDCMSLGLAFSCFDPPGADIGFGLEGHVMYTAARTKLINNEVERWLETTIPASQDCQVLNLGAGVDTRVYWMESLKRTNLIAYWEVDTASVLDYKQVILHRLNKNGELPKPMCERKPIAMNFAEESISLLPTSHDFDKTIPTCFILEGLIMYLKRPDVEQLMDALSDLSAPDSLLILNFSISTQSGAISIDEIDDRLQKKGWKTESRLMFGEEGFNFGRYPEGKPANKQLGFAMYRKE